MASWVAVCAVALANAACGPTVPPAAIDERVTVIPPELAVEIDTDRIAFVRAHSEELAARSAGDLIVSAQGEGFLRRVVGVQEDGERIVLVTEAAALGDAVIDGDVGEALVLDDGKWDSHSLQPIRIDVRGRRPIDSDALTVDVHRAALSLMPTLELDLEMRARRLEHFEAVLSSQLDAELDVEVRARAGTIKPAITLWRSVPMTFYQQIGVVPVVETAVISVGVRLEITARGDSRVRLRGTLRSTLDVGLRFADGRWQRVADASHELDGSLPAAELDVDELDVRAYLFTQLDVKFYGVAGPFINVGPYVQVDHPFGDEELRGTVGLYGEVGGTLQVFGVRVPALPRFELFDVAQPVF